jgi:hypothetical protein
MKNEAGLRPMKCASTAHEEFIALRFMFRLRNTSHEQILQSNVRVLHIAQRCFIKIKS